MQSPPIIDLGYAKYRGRRSSSRCTVYLGLPYAEPPLGHLRFRKPVSLNTQPVPNPQVIDATQYPIFAIQGATGSSDFGGAGSEDCLKVDLYVPADATPSSHYPVLVYIHGGGYRFGAPKNWPFNHWIDIQPRVVIVSVYYRLSVLGFLAHPDFIKRDDLADCNVGIHDQIEALRWTKNHVSRFGGDPNKITICGQSAGGSSVEIQLTAFGGQNRDLFCGAIAQSVYRTPVFQLDQKQPVFDALLKELKCPLERLDNQLEWLRTVNAVDLVQASDAVFARHHEVLWDWKPVIDGELLPDYPAVLLQSGRFVDVPVIVGATTDETPSTDDMVWSEELPKHWPLLTAADINDVAEKYIAQALSIAKAAGDGLNRSATLVFGEAFSKAWIYRYNQPAGNSSAVEHSSDNWQMFQGTCTGPNATSIFEPLTQEQTRFAEELVCYWLSFVETGNPNVHKPLSSLVWPEYRLTGERLVLQAPEKGGQGSGCFVEDYPDREKDRHRLWIGLVDRTQN